MVQYRTFLGGQLRESILGPIGSEPRGPTERDAARAAAPSLLLLLLALPPRFMIHCERAR